MLEGFQRPQDDSLAPLAPAFCNQSKPSSRSEDWSWVTTMVWIESTAGCSCPAGCSRVGFRQETKVRRVLEITHVHLAEVVSGLGEKDRVTSVLLGRTVPWLTMPGGSLRCFITLCESSSFPEMLLSGLELNSSISQCGSLHKIDSAQIVQISKSKRCGCGLGSEQKIGRTMQGQA